MRKIATLMVAAALLVVAGCGPDESREDARDVLHVDKTPPEVITFNNHYPNVETKCDHGHRIYVITKGSKRFEILPNDPSCAASRDR